MPTSVRLDSKTERLVDRMAKRRSATKSEVIREAIEILARQEETSPQNKRPYDIVADLIGCVRDGPPDLSSETGKKFREALERNTRENLDID